MRYWLHYWSQDRAGATFDRRHGRIQYLDHAEFRWLNRGDWLYVVAQRAEQLVLVLRSQVSGVEISPVQPIFSRGDSNFRIHFARREWGKAAASGVPSEALRRLRFVSNHTQLRGDVNGLANTVLAHARPITLESAEMLDGIWDVQHRKPWVNAAIAARIACDQREGEFKSTEGNKRRVFTTIYERQRRYRDEAIKRHGLTCTICRINFGRRYGEVGEGYMHVHHLRPLSKGVSVPDVETDLTVVCPNCHAMIHRNPKRTLEPDDVREAMAQARKKHRSG